MLIRPDIRPALAGLVFSLLLCLSSLSLRAQEPDLNQKLSVHYSGIPLEKVLEDITGKSLVKFSYSREMIPASHKVTYRAENEPLSKILYDIFRQSGIQYSLVGGYVVLKARPETEPGKQGKKEAITVSGTVADSMSNELMIGAVVYARETGVGVITNNYGFFSLTLPSGTHTLQASYLGYNTVTRHLETDTDIRWNIRLTPVPILMKEIIINPVSKEEHLFSSPAARFNVDPVVVQRQSAVLGETDMLKSLDNLPGISFQNDGSSYFSVRGGAYDQNLVLLDDAPIYNPSHLLGLFTPIIPEAIKHTDVYRADFPVQYGGRLSSVIDIRAREGNMSRFSGSASLGPVSTRFSVEGPLKKDASSYFLSFRLSTFGFFVKALNPSIERFSFADFTSKFNIRMGKRDRLYLTFFTGKDAFINNSGSLRTGLEWGNTAGTLRWSHIYGSRLFSNTTLYASRYDYALYTDYDKQLFWNSDITGSHLKSEFAWYIRPHNRAKFGFSLGGYFFNPGNYNAPDPALDTMRVSEVNSGELILYAGHEADLAQRIHLTYGVRITSWSNYGEAFSIVYDDRFNPVARNEYEKGERYFSSTLLEPRVSLSFNTGNLSSFKVSYNRTTQHINQINNSISPFNSLEVWLPSGPNIRPQYSDVVNLGFLKSWARSSVDLTTDVYYKKLYNQIDYSPHAEMFLNPYLEGEIRQGDGYAWGFEVLLKKTTGRLTGQMGYAFTRSYLQIDGLNHGLSYPSHQDRPVDISISADYRLKTRWSINLNMVYTSGMTLSTPSGFFDYRGAQVPVYEQQNNDRLPDYKRLDVGSSWRLNKQEKAFQHFFSVSLYNILSTRNYAFLYFNKIEGNDGKFYVPADRLKDPAQIPTYRYVYSLVPSFTYSLKF